jgi:cell wall-associated NlpC family hydrolase
MTSVVLCVLRAPSNVARRTRSEAQRTQSFSIKIQLHFTYIRQNIFEMDFAVVAFPAAPVRRKPGHQSEMVNQLLFGETVKVLKAKKALWVKVRSLHDGYEGWMTNTLLATIDEATAGQPANIVTQELLTKVVVEDGFMHVPAGSTLPAFSKDDRKPEGQGKIGDKVYRFTGPYLIRTGKVAEPGDIRNLATAWLNAPYLWGGRTPLGVDCSGLVQVVYKMAGLDLPRDAWQQAQAGKAIRKFRDVETGDLVFFDNKEDIVHVGIMLDKDHMIHASGKVKIDEMTKKGILNPDPRAKPLRLKAIRRIL